MEPMSRIAHFQLLRLVLNSQQTNLYKITIQYYKIQINSLQCTQIYTNAYAYIFYFKKKNFVEAINIITFQTIFLSRYRLTIYSVITPHYIHVYV